MIGMSRPVEITRLNDTGKRQAMPGVYLYVIFGSGNSRKAVYLSQAMFLALSLFDV